MSEENKKFDPMRLMFGMMVESFLETGKLLHELVLKYKANNIDVIPISELEAIESKGIEKTLSKGSLTQKLAGDLV
jgi:hypothetical protein